jgi:phage shock protein A
LPITTAEDIVKLFEEDVRSRKRLAELLISEPDIRLAMINAVLRDVATKDDIETLRREVLTQISELRDRVSRLEGAFTQLTERINDLDKRIDSLDKRIDGLDKRIDYVVRVSWVLTISVIATLVTQLILAFLRIV